jgi:hypothetical protein
MPAYSCRRRRVHIRIPGTKAEAPHTAMTTLPRAWPFLMYRMASETSLSG